MVTFKVIPVIDKMMGLYKMPISEDRFKAYLNLLRGGSRDDIVLPIQAFNPMAKSHVIEKLLLLKSMGIEEIMRSVTDTISFNHDTDVKFQVAFNLADDLKGGWTNYYTTDFDSKFKLNALVERRFCTPYFWVSEEIDIELIKYRTEEYCLRAFFFLLNGKPKTLSDHIRQEKFVAENSKSRKSKIPFEDINLAEGFLERHAHSVDYNLIFNFFYGHGGAQSLGFKSLDLPDNLGWRYLRSNVT